MSLSNSQTTQPKPSLHLESIRSRLIVTFVSIVLLSVFGISFISIAAEALGSNQKVINQLETILNYKQNALVTWVSGLQGELSNTLVGGSVTNDIESIIGNTASTEEDQNLQGKIDSVNQQLKLRVTNSQYFGELFVLDHVGKVVFSTDTTQNGLSFDQEPLFKVGMTSPYIDTPKYLAAEGKTELYASTPVYSTAREVIGVLAGEIRLTNLNAIVNDRTGLGETGVTYLVGMNRILVAGLPNETIGRLIQSQGIVSAFEGQSIGSTVYRNYKDVPVFGAYLWIPGIQSVLIAEQNLNESRRVVNAEIGVLMSVILASIIVAFFFALQITQNIAEPISDLAETAGRIAAGEKLVAGEIFNRLEGEAPEFRSDEIGVLTQAFSSMTSQLESLIDNLEKRVSDRTRDLDRRSSYLQASAKVSQVATSILDSNELQEQIVELIRESFGLYYVGLFLSDSKNEWAVLKAGTGEAGKVMLSRGHRLPIGQKSMIGWCIANAKARIAQVAMEDSVRLRIPELPNTNSEAAIPLRSRGRVLGAISVQSEIFNAFDEDTLNVLQSMADHVGVALDNSTLFSNMETALEAERRAYAIQTGKSWRDWFNKHSSASYVSRDGEVDRRNQVWNPEMEEALVSGETILGSSVSARLSDSMQPNSTEKIRQTKPDRLAIPIKVRGNIIGVLYTEKSRRGNFPRQIDSDPGSARSNAWTTDEISHLEEIAEQLGIALDGARMYGETQRRAEREMLFGEITSNMRTTLNIDTILRSSIHDIRKALNLEEVEVRLVDEKG
jgi:GAF domain-containing protein/HAMP domain-containing protein